VKGKMAEISFLFIICHRQVVAEEYVLRRVVDLDPDWIRIQWGVWIRIQGQEKEENEEKIQSFMLKFL
jgi:hypothetical protein